MPLDLSVEREGCGVRLDPYVEREGGGMRLDLSVEREGGWRGFRSVCRDGGGVACV